MTPLLILILTLLLYVLIGVVSIEIVLWLLAMVVTYPPRLRQLLYAILGVSLLIWFIAHMPHLL